MSGFHFQPRHVLGDFQPSLVQFHCYLEHLSSPNAIAESLYGASEIALDMMDFCALQEQLTPGIATHALKQIEGFMRGVLRRVEQALYVDTLARVGRAEQEYFHTQSGVLAQLILQHLGHDVYSDWAAAA